MKVILSEAQTIKARDYEAGAEVIVAKDLGERLIEEGIANRVVEQPENRIRGIPETVRRFSPYKKFRS